MNKLTCEIGQAHLLSKLGCCAEHPDSARKHGVSDEDIFHAYRNPIRVFELDDGFTMVIGANHAAIICELGVVDGVQAPVVVHAMRAREKFLR